MRARLVRARWKCVVLKVQLALRIQQLRVIRSEDPKGQSYPGGDLSYLVVPLREAGIYTWTCRQAFQATVFTQMAVQEVEHIGMEVSQFR